MTAVTGLCPDFAHLHNPCAGGDDVRGEVTGEGVCVASSALCDGTVVFTAVILHTKTITKIYLVMYAQY